ncbi:hypothetical protein Tco_1230748 [Tanacetum coccineum]
MRWWGNVSGVRIRDILTWIYGCLRKCGPAILFAVQSVILFLSPATNIWLGTSGVAYLLSVVANSGSTSAAAGWLLLQRVGYRCNGQLQSCYSLYFHLLFSYLREKKYSQILRNVGNQWENIREKSVGNNCGRSVAKLVGKKCGKSVGNNCGKSVAKIVGKKCGKSVGNNCEKSVAKIVGKKCGKSVGKFS